MPEPTMFRPVLPHLHPLLTDLARTARQPRTQARTLTLSYGLVLALGRRTLTQIQLACGGGDQDWSATYRLFRQPRLDQDTADQALLAAVVHHHPPHRPVPVVLDATQLRRTSRRMVGTGWLPAPRSPKWRPGLHVAQRWVGASVLLPRSAHGDSRCVPLRFLPAPTPSAKVWPDHPPVREWAAGLAHLQWLRTELDRLGRPTQRLLAIADGQYGCAALWRSLPHHTTLLSRCARNRALFARPTPRVPGTRGRQRLYGDQGPSPADQLHSPWDWQTTSVAVRSRQIPLRYRLTGPWLVKPAPHQPLFLLVVAGIHKRRHGRWVQRDPTCWLISAAADGRGGWHLPLRAPELLAWAWQRWEVEVLHKELKSGFGLGEAQAWHPVSAATIPRWVAWTVGCLVLAGYRAWGWTTGPPGHHGRWWRPRRWTARDVALAVRHELTATIPAPAEAPASTGASAPLRAGWVVMATSWPAMPPGAWRLPTLTSQSRRV